MQKVTMYKAENGKLFNTEEECREYEIYLGYRKQLQEIYENTAESDKSYAEIFTEEPEFVQKVAEAFDFTINKEELGSFTFYKFAPKEGCKDAKEKLKAWENFDTQHILPF